MTIKKYLCFSIAVLFAAIAVAQDREKFIIHRSLKVVGEETYTLKKNAKGFTVYNIECNYVDRGKEVPLKAIVELNDADVPSTVVIKGKTSRFQLIDDSINFDTKQAFVKQNSITKTVKLQSNSFPIDGYAPATLQWLLIKHWLKTGKPTMISSVPNGGVELKELGQDTILVNNHKQLFNAYAIKGVIWGWEYVWTDIDGRLAALNTINAEGDKIEFINEKYIDILLPVAQLSARNGVRNYPSKGSYADSDKLAIKNSTVINIETGQTIPHQTILCEDGVITWIGSDKEAKVPSGSKIIQAEGRSVLPGLWDMHAHLKQTEWGPAYVASGITTVRDMGNEFEFINSIKKSIDDKTGIGPTILRAGIIDGVAKTTNGIMVADSKEQAVMMVNKYKDAGYDQIKIYSSLSPEIVSFICDEADRVGLPIAGHIPTAMTLIETVNAGVTQVSHITFISKAMLYNEKTYEINFDADQNRQLLQYLKDKKVIVDPTLAIYEMLNRSLDSPMTDIEPAFASLPPMLQAHLITMGLPSEAAAKRKAWFEMHKKIVLKLVQEGIPVVAGTDMLIPGYSLYRELELYVQSGLTPLQALQTATVQPAKVMGMYEKVGSVTQGKKADLILINGNPAKNISDIRKIELVIKGGKIYIPKEVHQLIGFE